MILSWMMRTLLAALRMGKNFGSPTVAVGLARASSYTTELLITVK